MEWDCKSMLPAELKNLVAELGEKPFRAGQLFSWLAFFCHVEKRSYYRKNRRKLVQGE